MDYESMESEFNLSLESLLSGMDNQDNAVAYLNELCAAINDEVSVGYGGTYNILSRHST